MANKARGARGAPGVVLAVCTAVLVLGMSGTANAALFARSGINAATTGEYISGYGVACANWVPNNPQLDPNYGPIYDPGHRQLLPRVSFVGSAAVHAGEFELGILG